MDKDEMREWLQDELKYAEETTDMEGNPIKSTFLGTYMSLDPCGKYHHIIAPNGATDECEEFWEMLEEVAGELNAWTESGEGDPCDVFLCASVDE